MRLLTILILFVTTTCVSQELKKLRMDYPKANLEAELTNSLHEELATITLEHNKTLVAYKGAVLTLKAKFASGIKNKKGYFKEGVRLLENAIASEPNNLEIRCLRLGVQENAPKIVGYKQQIKEDKQFILDHYKSNTNQELRRFIKGYVVLSDVFTEAEKQLF